MDLRCCCLSFLLTLPLAAQVPVDPPAATPPAPQDPAGQDAEKPSLTPEEQLAELEREKERLLREIQYVHERVANYRQVLGEKLQNRSFSARAIDAGRSATVQPTTPPVARRPARTMLEDEAATHPADVVATVAGQPIHKGLLDQLIAHQSDKLTAEMRQQIAFYELIRIEGTAAQFDSGELEDRLAPLIGALGEGKTVAELAGVHGTLPGAPEDGAIEISRNQQYGLRLEQVAFGMQPGETSRPFRHYNGIVVLHLDSIEKGASPELDKLRAHVVMVPYTLEPEQMQKAQTMVNTAQIDIAVRDEATMAMVPMAYRDVEVTPPGRTEIEVMERTLQELADEIARASAADDEVEKSRLPALEMRYQRMKQELQTRRERAEAEPGQTDATRKIERDPGGDGKAQRPEAEPQDGGR